jgi:hypothetical protein
LIKVAASIATRFSALCANILIAYQELCISSPLLPSFAMPLLFRECETVILTTVFAACGAEAAWEW